MLSTRQARQLLLKSKPSAWGRYNGSLKSSSTLNYFQGKRAPPKPMPGSVNPQNPAYAHYYKPRRSTPWGTILFYSAGVIGIAGFLVYEFVWPKHTFSSPVAKILRRALWAESEKEDHNYAKALDIYKEALAKCVDENLSEISDEYTGIQIKIGEMCERLGKLDEAIDVYYDISQNYFKYLQAHIEDPPNEDTRHIVQKDLRIIIKIAELSKDHPPFLTSLLTIHLEIALHEVVKRLIARGQSYEDLVTAGKSAGASKLAITEDGTVLDPSSKIDTEIWQPFKEEYFNARDLLSALLLVTRGPSFTVTHKTQTLSWMILANSPIGETMLNMCNLASLCYLTAETIESDTFKLKRQLKDATTTATTATAQTDTINQSTIPSQQQIDFLEAEVTKHDNLRKAFIDKSLDLYSKAIGICKKIPPKQRSKELEEATVLATYGAGVVNLHLGQYDDAERFLKEAILRARGSNQDFALQEAERELDKLNKERARLSNGGPSNQDLKEQQAVDTVVEIPFAKK